MSERPVLTKAWIVGGAADARIVKASSESSQLPDDPFNYSQDGEGGLVRPLYDLDQLAAMPEGNSLHARCVKQKATDVAGRGFVLRSTKVTAGHPVDVLAGDEDAWAAFLTEVEDDERGDESFAQRVTQAAHDYEAIGWAVLEVSRRADGILDGLWHVPAHTIRAHIDGKRFAQKRAGKSVWFKRFGLDGTVDRANGGFSARTASGGFVGNELIVIRNYTPRSSYYGLPDHIPALSAIAGWRAQAEFNIRFFDNNAVPSFAVVIEGADLSPELEEEILDHFRKLKGDPHRTLILPVPGSPGDEAVQVKVRFEKLSADVKDASFRLYKSDNALEICIAHGMPPYRVGWPIIGSLGGSTAEEMTQIYNDSIVQPRQETWEQRLTRALLGVKGLDLADVILKAAELDTRNEMRDVEKAQAVIEMGAATPAWAAQFLGLPERTDPGGDLYVDQRPSAAPAGPSSGFGSPFGSEPIDAALLAKRWGAEVTALSAIRKQLEAMVPAELAA